MEDIDDIKFAVIDNRSKEIVGFFGDEHFADDFINSQTNKEFYEIIKRDDGFYIDIHTSTTSSFSIYN